MQKVERPVRLVSEASHKRTEGVLYPVSTTDCGNGVRVLGGMGNSIAEDSATRSGVRRSRTQRGAGWESLKTGATPTDTQSPTMVGSVLSTASLVLAHAAAAVCRRRGVCFPWFYPSQDVETLRPTTTSLNSMGNIRKGGVNLMAPVSFSFRQPLNQDTAFLPPLKN